MYKITASADLYFYYDENTKSFDFESSNEFSICNAYLIDHQSEFDNFLSAYKENIIEECIRISNEKKETEIMVYYYVEFNVDFYVQTTMNGTETDSEYELIDEHFEYLGKAEEEKLEAEQTKDTSTFDVNINPMSW